MIPSSILAAALQAVLRDRLTHLDVSLLCLLHGPGHLSYVELRPFKRAVLMRLTGVKRRTLYDAIDRLEAAGYLVRGAPIGDPGRQLRTYRLENPVRPAAPLHAA